MGELGCTKKIELQTLVAPRGRKYFGNLFFWVQNILPGGLIGLLTKMAKKDFGHLGHIFEQILGLQV